jgi:hypothetical protein
MVAPQGTAQSAKFTWQLKESLFAPWLGLWAGRKQKFLIGISARHTVPRTSLFSRVVRRTFD